MKRIDPNIPANGNSANIASFNAIDSLFKEHCRKKQEIEKEAQNQRQRKHDYFVAVFSAIASAFFTNIDRIIKFIMELIP